MKAPGNMSIGALRRAYAGGGLTVSDVARQFLSRLEGPDQDSVWISTCAPDRLLAAAAALDAQVADMDALPLFGVPFSVKDNIDAEGEPTTAACPGFAYHAVRSAEVVARAVAAGALYVGKTNLDQFATGLVGVRSPYGVPKNPFNADYIPGGSSAGAGVSVSTGMVGFAFGTDTGGSGRIPASYNGIYGLKPAPGDWSRAGLVYACRSFDTPTVFAASLDDVMAVDAVVRGHDRADPFSRNIARTDVPAPRVALAAPGQIDTFGDADVAALYRAAHARILAAFPDAAAADLAPFQSVNDLMFFGPFLAERDVSVGDFLDANPDGCHPVVRDLILSSRAYSAADAYRALYRLAEAACATRGFWDGADVLITPTVGALVTRAAIAADPLGPNFNNGRYTNFANPLGLAGLAVPMGRSGAGVPWGVTLYGLPERMAALMSVARAISAGPPDIIPDLQAKA
ncbi:MAG: allophanate hydrolase/aspartyl-tRNA(Asn)/glutamyl-tRNA(Gln) amidotransferase subunit A [Paracoccaceae bacterium]|jgi:allophanate hydrolase/aspartyl-tRNA(Asn)/glutamyl-tRNA(Gln) amidotransferase subunit A